MAPDGLARRAADHLPPRARPGARAPEARVRLEAGAGLRRDRDAAGRELPDQWIIRGNHHDAWVNGAQRSGQRHGGGAGGGARDRRAGEGRLAPRRTLVYAAWDAEEPGLLGSTEWVEDHAEELQRARSSPTSTPTPTPAASSASAARTRWSASSTRWRATCPIRRSRRHAIGERLLARHACSTGVAEARDGGARRAGASRSSALGLGLRLHAVPAAPRHRVAQHRLRRRGRVRAVPLDLRLVRPLRALHGSRLRLRRGAGEGRRARGAAAGRGGRAAVRVRALGGADRHATSSEVERARRRRCETETDEHNRRLDDGTFDAGGRSDETLRGAGEEGRRCRTSTSRRCRTRWRGCSVAARRFDAASAAALRDGATSRRATLAQANAVLLHGRARADARRGAAAPALVPAPGLRARATTPGYGVKTLPAVREAHRAARVGRGAHRRFRWWRRRSNATPPKSNAPPDCWRARSSRVLALPLPREALVEALE